MLTDKDAVQKEINVVLGRLIREMLEVRLLGDINNDKTADTRCINSSVKFKAQMT